jgi:hypothetical protein
MAEVTAATAATTCIPVSHVNKVVLTIEAFPLRRVQPSEEIAGHV